MQTLNTASAWTGVTHGCNIDPYTAISIKVVGKNVDATIPKGNMGYDQHAVSDTVAVESSIVAFL